MTYQTISMPFNFNAYGQVNATDDQKKIWQDRVQMVALTRFGERVMRPDFGSDLALAVFETEDIAVEIINRSLTIAFNTWLSSLELKEINPVINRESGTIEISILYKLPSGELDQANIKTAIFNRSGDLLQEITNG